MDTERFGGSSVVIIGAGEWNRRVKDDKAEVGSTFIVRSCRRCRHPVSFLDSDVST